MFSQLFVIDAAERAAKTVAQSLLSLWLVGEDVFNILNVNWEQAWGVALGAGVISILTSIISYKAVPGNSASLVVENVKEK